MRLIKKDEKITTNFEAVDNEDVINKVYLDEKFKKIDGYISYMEKEYNDFKLQSNKHSVEETSIQRASKTTTQRLYDESLFDSFPNEHKILKDFLFVRGDVCRGDLHEVKDVIQ